MKFLRLLLALLLCTQSAFPIGFQTNVTTWTELSNAWRTCSSITFGKTTNQCKIIVAPGFYHSPVPTFSLFLTNDINIEGAGMLTTELRSAVNGQGAPFIVMGTRTRVANMSLSGTNTTAGAITPLLGCLDSDLPDLGGGGFHALGFTVEYVSFNGIADNLYFLNNPGTMQPSIDGDFYFCKFNTKADFLLLSVGAFDQGDLGGGTNYLNKSYLRFWMCDGTARGPDGVFATLGINSSGYGFSDWYDCNFTIENGTNGGAGFWTGANANAENPFVGGSLINTSSNGAPAMRFYNCKLGVSTTNGGPVYQIYNRGSRIEALSTIITNALNTNGGIFMMPNATRAYWSRTNQVGNVGTGEDDLHTNVITAWSLFSPGQQLVFRASGTTATNTNQKRWKVRLGSPTAASGTVLFDTGAMNFNQGQSRNTGVWEIEGRIVWNHQTSAKATVRFSSSSSVIPSHTTLTNLSIGWHTNLVWRLTGEATSDNDIICESSTGEWRGSQ